MICIHSHFPSALLVTHFKGIVIAQKIIGQGNEDDEPNSGGFCTHRTNVLGKCINLSLYLKNIA